MVLALRGDGDIAGEIAGETTGRRNATIRAIDRVRALIVRHDKFSSFLDANPGADRAFRRVVTQKWNDADTKLRRHAVTTGGQRLASLLLHLAERHGREADGVIHLVMPLSQEELASLAGTSRATVTRAFGNWRKRSLIRTGHRRITILDPAGLRKGRGPGTSRLASGQRGQEAWGNVGTTESPPAAGRWTQPRRRWSPTFTVTSGRNSAPSMPS